MPNFPPSSAERWAGWSNTLGTDSWRCLHPVRRIDSLLLRHVRRLHHPRQLQCAALRRAQLIRQLVQQNNEQLQQRSVHQLPWWFKRHLSFASLVIAWIVEGKSEHEMAEVIDPLTHRRPHEELIKCKNRIVKSESDFLFFLSSVREFFFDCVTEWNFRDTFYLRLEVNMFFTTESSSFFPSKKTYFVVDEQKHCGKTGIDDYRGLFLELSSKISLFCDTRDARKTRHFELFSIDKNSGRRNACTCSMKKKHSRIIFLYRW